MSKIISEDLFYLIKSLTKSEKRFFVLYANRLNKRNKKFVTLFQLIEKQKKYDEAALLSKAKRIDKKLLPSLKIHLYKQVLKSLMIANADKKTDVKIKYLVGQARILYDKCLYKQAIKMLTKAKEIAQQHDRNILLLEIVELEKSILLHTLKHRDLETVDSLIKKANDVTEKVYNTNQFANLALRLNSFYLKVGFIRNKKEYINVKKFFYESLPEYREEHLFFNEKLYLYFSYIGYYFFIQKFDKGLIYAQKTVQLFDENPSMISNQLEMYIKALNSLLVVQNKLLMYDDFIKTHQRLISIKRLPAKHLNENISLNLFKAIYIHEINKHYMMGEFKEGTKIVRRLNDYLNQFITKLDKHNVLIFYYKIACLYFGSSNFKQALFWLNKLVSQPISDLRQDLQSFARILSLICHYELGKTDLLEYSIKSTYRFLLKQKDLNLYQKYILDFLKKVPYEITEKNIRKHFIGLRDKMIALESNSFEKRPFLYFDIVSWLESKIYGKPVEDIIKAKFELKNTR